jgi:hypothetical protein
MKTTHHAMNTKKPDMQTMIAFELAKRGHTEALTPEVLAKLDTPDLLALQNAGIPGTDSAKRGSGTRQNVLAAMRNRSGITVREAVLKACSAEALTSAEVIDALEELRPGTPTPTTRAEIKRLEVAGSLVHTGPQIGGRYRTIPSLRG